MNKTIPTDPSVVDQSYRGRIGCMCGCRGTYSYTARRASNALRDIRAAVASGATLNTGTDVAGRRYFATDHNGRTIAVYCRA